MVSGLVAADIDFVVIGGLAARAHGSPRITEDLDICYDPAPGNVERLAALLRDWKAYLRGVEPGLPFIMDERTFRDTPVMTLSTTHGALDVMDRVAGVGDYGRVLAASVPISAGPVTFRALDLPALLAAKRATGRPRDLAQIPELEALLELRRKAGRGR
jgi:hypothetical protein